MRYYIISLLLLFIIIIILYFVLNRLYDYFSHKEQLDIYKISVREHQRNNELEHQALKNKKELLEREIFAKSEMVHDLAEIKNLEKELEEVNELIDGINQNNPS